jgi:hypothetical protein
MRYIMATAADPTRTSVYGPLEHGHIRAWPARTAAAQISDDGRQLGRGARLIW